MSVKVIMGSMFAGKTSELIRRVKRYRIAGKKIIVFKHSLDCERYSESDIATHDRDTFEAVPVSDSYSMERYITNEEVIAIDEVQFFDSDIIPFVKKMNDNNKKLILAGLDMDYMGNPFGHMGELCCLADEVIKLHAVCKICGENAKYSYRNSDTEEQIAVGGAKEYIAVCDNCMHDLKEMKKIKEDTHE